MATRFPRVDHLTSEEVDYELIIRGKKESTKDELNDKYRLLRNLFHEDAKGNRTYLCSYTMDQQYDYIANKIDMLARRLEKGRDERSISRLKHYLMRVERCVAEDSRSVMMREDLTREIKGFLLQFDRNNPSANEQNGQEEGAVGGEVLQDTNNFNGTGAIPKEQGGSQQTQNTKDYEFLINQIYKLEQELAEMREKQQRQCSPGYPNSRGNSERRSMSREREQDRMNGRGGRNHRNNNERGNNRSHTVSETEIITADRRMEKWHLSFSGDSRQRSLEDFLHKVRRLARMDHIAEDILLQRIHTILRGEAYDWYLCYSEEFANWEDFEERIRYMYGNPNRDQGNRQKIYERKQQRSETFLTFKMEVERLNKLLSNPLDPGRLFEIIWDNMRPHYRSRLACRTVRELGMLEYYAYRIDANDPTLKQQREGPIRPTNAVHNIEVTAEGSYSSCSESEEVNEIRKKFDRNTRIKEGERPHPEQRPRVSQENTEGRTIPLCWNCSKNGHLWRNCQEPKRIFCYACGNPGKTTVSCPNHIRDPQQSTQRSGN